jgi:hypothetical protein
MMATNGNKADNVQHIVHDNTGSPVAVVRMNPLRSYAGIPQLLQSYINDEDNQAWEEIRRKIDYTYNNLGVLMEELNSQTGMEEQLREWLATGKKLLFKPNLVNPLCIDPQHHGEAMGYDACTGWPFMAALMKWFHDRLDISFHSMCIGEAATAISQTAAFLSRHYTEGRAITTEAVIEGRSDDFYGGWGFYFVRKYLAERHPSTHDDDPMEGYAESVAGKYISPGDATDKLMVYDLNRIYDIQAKRRDVEVADGINFKNITLHKAIIGGDPEDADDFKGYPGCILVNVPRLKVHSQTLLTNAIKNLGVGLYPMEVATETSEESTNWKYSYPQQHPPTIKSEIPHMPWMSVLGEDSLPTRDREEKYIVKRTYGLNGTMVDMVRAVQNVGVPAIHIIDSIFAVNYDHTGRGAGKKVFEGMAFASFDAVALDMLCARYMFKNIPVLEARSLQQDGKITSEFVQKVPLAVLREGSIRTIEGFDEPLSRYSLFSYAERRGLGRQDYYAVGWDAINYSSIFSQGGHIGYQRNGEFHEIITEELYFANGKPLWDIQASVLSYARANDSLTNSTYYDQLMKNYDENGDGIIDYDEMGKKGFWCPLQRIVAWGRYLYTIERYGFLHGDFFTASRRLKYSNENWNTGHHDFIKDYLNSCIPALALQMSRDEMESEDQFYSGLLWGKGKWPSWQFANFVSVLNTIYRAKTKEAILNNSLYGLALQYADKRYNGGVLTGSTGMDSHPDTTRRYFQAIESGMSALDFILYVPSGFGKLNDESIPNVIETDNPHLIFTAHFNNDEDIW